MHRGPDNRRSFGKLVNKALAKSCCWLRVSELSAAQRLLDQTRFIGKAPLRYQFLSCNKDCSEISIAAIDRRSVLSVLARLNLLPR
jgi:hypothetical protein